MSEKIYVGNGREKEFDSGGSVINVHLTLNNMKSLFEEYGYTAKNGDMRIKLNIASRKEQGTYGETHTVTVDTWKPGDNSETDPFGEAGNEEEQEPEVTPVF
ncbi:hypothetical protein KAR91_57125 [Candidatus Pacearchaeota archaeon]|nr:hypothetical protein [Candidatus Pacearchaeota archaeon]